MLRVRLPGQLRLPVDQRAAVERREQPLVRIDDEAVRPLDALEQVPHRRRRQRRRSVRAVHMHPDTVLGAHVRHAGQVVDDSEVCGA